MDLFLVGTVVFFNLIFLALDKRCAYVSTAFELACLLPTPFIFGGLYFHILSGFCFESHQHGLHSPQTKIGMAIAQI